MKENMLEKKRIDYIDLAKGFCIIIVVLHHIESSMKIHYWFDMYMKAFRMPLYFLLSGLFFKSYENFYGFLVRKTNKLLIPFFFFYFTLSILPTLSLRYLGFPNYASIKPFEVSSLYSFVWPENFANIPIWFLWCLFVINVFFYIIYLASKKISNIHSELMAPLVIVICLIVGFLGKFLSFNGINLPAFIDSAMVALPFFALGFVLNKHTDFLTDNRFDKFNYCFVLLSVLIVFLFTTGNINYRTNTYGVNFFQLYIVGIFGSFVILFSSKIIKKLPLISYWGRYSIIILVSHDYVMQVFIYLSKMIVGINDLSLYLALMSTMLSYLIIIPIMVKYLGYFVAQKDVIKIK